MTVRISLPEGQESLEIPPQFRLCWACKHMRYHDATPGYSELTPGNSARVSCAEYRMKEGGLYLEDGIKLAEIREAMETAQTCPEWSPDR